MQQLLIGSTLESLAQMVTLIVKAGEVYLVVAVGKDDVTLLTQLTEEQLSEVPDLSAAQNRFPMDGKAAQENFREVLNRVKEHFPKK